MTSPEITGDGTNAERAPDEPGALQVRVRTSGGSPLPDAALSLIDGAGYQTTLGRTGPGGTFDVTITQPGRYVVVASAPPYRPQAATVQVRRGAYAPVDLVLAGAGHEITGTVTGAGGAPVAGARVALAGPEGQVVATQATGAEGRYVLAGLAPGEYTLVVSTDGGAPRSRPVSVPVLDGGRHDIALAGASRLRGVARSAGGRPVPEARVVLLDESGAIVAETTTDEHGAYAFTDAPEGDLVLVATGFPPVSGLLRLSAGAVEHDIEFRHPGA